MNHRCDVDGWVGNDAYAMEELVELGAALLYADLGITDEPRVTMRNISTTDGHEGRQEGDFHFRFEGIRSRRVTDFPASRKTRLSQLGIFGTPGYCKKKVAEGVMSACGKAHPLNGTGLVFLID